MDEDTIYNSIQNVYNELLEREPDISGIKCYSNKLRTGMTIEQIRTRIKGSDEYNKLQIKKFKREKKMDVISTSEHPRDLVKTFAVDPRAPTEDHINKFTNSIPKTIQEKQKILNKRKKVGGRLTKTELNRKRLQRELNKSMSSAITENETANSNFGQFKNPNMNGENCELLTDFYLEYSTKYKPPTIKDEILSVVITNWRRPERLEKCVQSVVENGIQNIVVSCSETPREIIDVLNKIIDKYPFIQIVATPYDSGCNWCWLSGVYMTTTSHLIVLHDDDLLSSEFKKAYQTIIKPKLETGKIGHVYWDGIIYDINQGKLTDEYHTNARGHPAETGEYDPATYYEPYRSPKSLYPLSPVVQILDAEQARRTLKECEMNLTDPLFFYPRKTMLIGNDIMLNLRNLQKCINTKKQMLYVHQGLTYYGRWEDSISQYALDKNESPQLTIGYKKTREYFNNHLNVKVVYPIVIHTTSFFKPRNENDLRRHRFALRTWIRQYINKQMIFCPLFDSQLTRSSRDVGDKLFMPFIRDIFEHGYKRCSEDDIIAFCNSDICMIDNTMNYAIQNAKRYGCTYSFRRDICGEKLSEFLTRTNIEMKTRWYVGMDFTAFTTKWWANWKHMTTDNLIGKPTWDWMMRFLMSYSHNPQYALTTPVSDLGKVLETPNIIYHEKHESYAERPENYNLDSANVYCFTNMVYFLLRYYNKTQMLKYKSYIMNLELILTKIDIHREDKSKVITEVIKELVRKQTTENFPKI
jgi:hypothetical protein